MVREDSDEVPPGRTDVIPAVRVPPELSGVVRVHAAVVFHGHAVLLVRKVESGYELTPRRPQLEIQLWLGKACATEEKPEGRLLRRLRTRSREVDGLRQRAICGIAHRPDFFAKFVDRGETTARVYEEIRCSDEIVERPGQRGLSPRTHHVLTGESSDERDRRYACLESVADPFFSTRHARRSVR